MFGRLSSQIFKSNKSTKVINSSIIKRNFISFCIGNKKNNSISRKYPYFSIQSHAFWGSPTKEGKEPFYPVRGKLPINVIDADDTMEKLESNQRVFIHGAMQTPLTLVDAMCHTAKKRDLKNVELIHIHLHGDLLYTLDEYKPHFRDNSLFIGGNVRKMVNKGEADFTPIFLSEIPSFFEADNFDIDFALIQVSPPDKHGYCSLGCSVDVTRSAVIKAKNVIGLINKYVPRTHGDGHIHISHFDYVTEYHKPLPEASAGGAIDDKASKIGQIIAENLIPDRACLQLGIGGIPDAVLNALYNHKDIGVHTEMFSDGILGLVDSGIITNHYKYHHCGKITSSFCVGSKKLYDFINDNPMVLLFDCSFVNDTEVIRVNNRTHAINSCLEIDLTGQVCADSLGTTMFSGIGGQMDFMRGAKLSYEGKAVMAMSSITNKGESKISPVLKPGAGVVTTRAHMQFMVTEYGYAEIYGKTLRERAKLLIDLAHPDHREMLEKAAFERFGPLTLNGSDGDIKVDGDN